MPELPEVETMRRGVLPICGSTIVDARRTRCDRKKILVTPTPALWKKQAIKQKIIDVERVGKRVVVRLENGNRIVFEPRMTGLVLLSDPPTKAHLRFELKLDSTQYPQLLYWDRRGLGSVRLFSEKEFQEKFFDGSVGPDAMQVNPKQLEKCFQNCRQPIKPALLNQKKLAGVGNLYASEILFAAKISPNVLCSELTSKQWKRIHQSMVNILTQAIAYEGSTLGDGTYRNALNQEGGFQNHHRVYDREGKPCPKCKSPILRIVQTQRATFFCPNCQTKNAV